MVSIKYLLFVDFIFLCMMNGCFGSDANTAENVTSLRKALLKDYDPYLRPRRLQKNPVIINATFGVNRLHDLNEKERKISILGYFRFTWIDEFLVWDKEKHQNISDIVVKTDDIWWPTIGLANPIADFETMKNTYGIFQVSSSGVITWSPGALFSVMCEMKLQKFPFDTQTCDFIFVVLGYTKKDIVINANPDILCVQGTTEWDILETKFLELSGGSNGLNIRFTLRRKPYFVLLTLTMPLTLLSYLNIFVFLIPVESGEKTSYAISTFLAYSIYLSVMGSSLPDDAESIVYMTLYIEIMMFLSVLIMALVIIQIRLVFYHGDDRLPCCPENSVTNEEETDVISIDVNDKSIRKDDVSSKSKKRTWSSSMAMIDRILFAFFFLALCTFNILFFSLMLR